MIFKYILIFIFIYLVNCDNNNEFDKFYDNLLEQNFPVQSKSYLEINSLKKLTSIITKINDYYITERSDNVSNPIYLQRNRFSFVINTLTRILDIVGFRNLYLNVRDGVSTAITCLSCHSLSTLIFNNIVGRETMGRAFHEVCTRLRLSTPRVCEGLVEQMSEHVDYIRKNARLKPTEICGILMGSHCFIGRSDNLFWKLDIPKRNENRVHRAPDTTETDMKILQITDIHLDLNYNTGSSVRCDEPLCCHKENSKQNETAGKWGAYPCDIPLETVDHSLQQIAQNSPDIDLWYWTGDTVAHDIWQYSRNTSLTNSRLITDMLKKYSNGKQVIPVIGNHEAVPVNCFPPPSVNNSYSISWLYKSLSEQWSQWLPFDALELIRYAGYYTFVVRPGFRIIVVNTNYCARLNIWTYYDSIDPADQLKWLIKELVIAEDSGDRVHIVGHVPVDNRECTQAWVYNYLAIVDRFSDTIVGQFFGHTHADEFRVLYSNENNTKPVGFEIVSPSLTTFEHFNPSYRVITARPNGIITDLETYYFNLTEANQLTQRGQGSPKWSYEYSMSKRYSLKEFSHFEFDGLIRRLMTNDSDLRTFYFYYYRFSDCLTNDFCDRTCRDKFFNDIVIGNPYDKTAKSILHRG